MQIGVLYAMECEAAPMLALRKADEPENVAGIPFYRLSDHLIACISGVGKVNSAMAAQILIDRFGVGRIVNAGCAGAFRDLAVGTLVVGTKCVQHDMDTTLAGDAPGVIPAINKVFLSCEKSAETLDYLKNQGFAPIPGVIASGDWFGRDYARAAAVRDNYSATVCDMEACAVAQVCYRNDISFVSFKVVSDHLFAEHQEEEYAKNSAPVETALAKMTDAYLRELEKDNNG